MGDLLPFKPKPDPLAGPSRSGTGAVLVPGLFDGCGTVLMLDLKREVFGIAPYRVGRSSTPPACRSPLMLVRPESNAGSSEPPSEPEA